jgi:hypothetical protein
MSILSHLVLSDINGFQDLQECGWEKKMQL